MSYSTILLLASFTSLQFMDARWIKYGVMCYYKSMNNEAGYVAAMCQFVTVQIQNNCLQKYYFLNNKIKKDVLWLAVQNVFFANRSKFNVM